MIRKRSSVMNACMADLVDNSDPQPDCRPHPEVSRIACEFANLRRRQADDDPYVPLTDIEQEERCRLLRRKGRTTETPERHLSAREKQELMSSFERK